MTAKHDRARPGAGAQDRLACCPDTMVIHGDALDPEILEEVNVQPTETMVAVSNDDEVNILASLLAKRYGCQRAMTLDQQDDLCAADHHARHRRRGQSAGDHRLDHPAAYPARPHPGGPLAARRASARSSRPRRWKPRRLVGSPLREGKLPAGVIIGAIVRDGEVIIPRGDTVIRPTTGWSCSATRARSRRSRSCLPSGWSSSEVFIIFRWRAGNRVAVGEKKGSQWRDSHMSTGAMCRMAARRSISRTAAISLPTASMRWSPIIGGRLIDEEPHLDRLDRSLGELGSPGRWRRAVLKMVMRELVRRNRVERRAALPADHARRGAARPQVPERRHGAGAGDDDAAVGLRRQRASSPTASRSSPSRTSAGSAATSRRCPCCRTARQAAGGARRAPTRPGWSTRDGMVTEGTSTNAWIVTHDGKLVTRQADPCHPERHHPAVDPAACARRGIHLRGAAVHASPKPRRRARRSPRARPPS